MLSEAFGDDLEVTLIDKSDAFVFGFSKLDVMFGRTTPDAVRLPYRDIAKPGVRFLQETITAIDPEARRVTTDAGVHEADVLVVALGADYDFDATPGPGRRRKRVLLRAPAPSGWPGSSRRSRRAASSSASAARRSSALRRRASVRCCSTTRSPSAACETTCEISFVIPLARPVPPSPETSAALETEFAKRGISLHPRPPHRVGRSRRAASRPRRRHRAAVRPVPRRAQAPRARRGDRQRHDRGRLRARRLGDAADPLPRCLCGRRRRDGRRAEGGRVRRGRRPRRRAAADRRAPRRRAPRPATTGAAPATSSSAADASGAWTSTSSPAPAKTGSFNAPSAALVAEKEHFGSSRRARWFGA